ncbi:hypothetical protein A5821_000377 [Enterococcus sp. 7F3_DIV0205]|uniref:DUF3829 domain-containing protein n=1 Tax=Candidatus Enterococcus palustris TaxID=1834189 RepID=A0AAQ3WBE0_9ENTE|nr:DUF3829 domain-containing protein [Enterococcus sp. 7F3_DIV0205]OTN84790.1 hypothetical protein A5821_000719 [Enterococcus sp. 7F3_DIV0205]
MRNKSKVFVVMLVFSVIIVMTACSTLKQAKESIDNDDSYSPKMDEGDKYNAYVDLLNVLSDELATIEHSYAENHMDEEGNFVPTEQKNAYGYSGGISLVQRAIESADNALSTKPKMNVDQDVKALLTVLKKEVSILEEIESYYKEKDFLNDHDEKGKELNSKLLSAYKEADGPIKKFSDNMQTLMSETDKKDREVHEKEGNEISLAMLQFIDAAKEVRDLVDDSITEDGTVNLTTEKYAEVNTKVSKALDKLKEVPKDSKAIEKEGFSSSTASIYIDRFVDKASDFKSVSNALSVSFGGDEETLSDAVAKLSSEYSELIDAYNNI